MFSNTREPSAACQKYHNGAASNTKVQLGSAGRLNLYGAILENEHSAAIYIQFFDAAATGDVTLGTTVPTWSLRLPASGVVQLDQNVPWHHFVKGCVFAMTATRTGSGAPSAAAAITLYFSQS